MIVRRRKVKATDKTVGICNIRKKDQHESPTPSRLAEGLRLSSLNAVREKRRNKYIPLREGVDKSTVPLSRGGRGRSLGGLAECRRGRMKRRRDRSSGRNSATRQRSLRFREPQSGRRFVKGLAALIKPQAPEQVPPSPFFALQRQRRTTSFFGEAFFL